MARAVFGANSVVVSLNLGLHFILLYIPFQSPEIKRRHRDAISTNNHIVYGLGNNTIFFRIQDETMDQTDHNKVIREFNEWGQPIVLDLAFMKDMTYQQVSAW